MTATRNLQIGRITTATDGRFHMAFSGRTPCGSGATASISYPATSYGSINLQLLCRRCFTPANLTRAQAEATTGGRFNAALDNFLCDVRRIVGYAPEPTTTARPAAPTQRPALTAALARRPQKPLSAWGQIANTFANTHTRPARAAA